jgi:prevent-host-death family protein
MSAVTIHQAKTNLSRLIAEVEAGGDVTISRGNIPVARLVAIAPKPKRVPGMYAHLGPLPDSFFEPLPEEELAAWDFEAAAEKDFTE